jgi:hypothetical protein
VSQLARTQGAKWPLIGALSLITYVVGHQLIFAATYGAGAIGALARTGHDVQWSTAVVTVALFAVALAALALREINRLTRQARQVAVESFTHDDARPHALLRGALALWLPTVLIALALFVVAENIERVAAGLAAPGLGVLGGTDYHFTLVIFGAVSAAFALVAALYRWRRAALLEAIAAAE